MLNSTSYLIYIRSDLTIRDVHRVTIIDSGPINTRWDADSSIDVQLTQWTQQRQTTIIIHPKIQWFSKTCTRFDMQVIKTATGRLSWQPHDILPTRYWLLASAVALVPDEWCRKTPTRVGNAELASPLCSPVAWVLRMNTISAQRWQVTYT